MEQCDCLPGCPFFNDKMTDQTGMAAIYKRRYCKGDFMRCARHLVKEAIEKAGMPEDARAKADEEFERLKNGQ